MANDFSWIEPASKNISSLFGLDPRAKAEGKVLQGKADLQEMELKNKPILYQAQAGNQNAQAGYHNAKAGAIAADEAAKADFGNALRGAVVMDNATGQIHLDPNKISAILANHPYAPKAMAGLGDAIANLNLQVGPQYKAETEQKYVESGVDEANPQPPQLEDVPTGKFIQTTQANSLQPSAQLRSVHGAGNAKVLSDPNLSVTPEGKKAIVDNKLQSSLAVQGLKNEGNVAAAIARAATPRAGVAAGPKSTDVVNSGKWINEAEQTVVQMLAGGENMDPETARAIANAAYQDRFGNGMPTENASVVIGDFLKKNKLASGVLKDPWGWGKNTMGVKREGDTKMLGSSDISSLVSGQPAARVTPQARPAAAQPTQASPVASAVAPQQAVPDAQPSPFGLRNDGSPKGPGFFQLKGNDGTIMTEVTVGVKTGNGTETEIPTLVPTLSESEKEYLRTGGDPRKSPSIMTKAITHANERLKSGKSVFAEAGEATPQAAKPPANIPAIEQRVDGHIYEIPGKGKYKWNASTQKWSPA